MFVPDPNPKKRAKESENTYPVMVVSRVNDIEREEQKALAYKNSHTLLDVILTQPKTALITNRVDSRCLQ